MEPALQTIYEEKNAPSAYQLYMLARKAGHAITKKQVDEFVKRQAATQVLTAKKAPVMWRASFRPPAKTRSAD